MNTQATIAAHHHIDPILGYRPSLPGNQPRGSLIVSRHRRHRPGLQPATCLCSLERVHWPHNGESRYRPALLHARRNRLQHISRRTTEADDRHDQHLDPDACRHNSAGGGTR